MGLRSFHGYESYRGRSALQTILKVVIIVLLLVLLALVGGYYLLENYVVYTDEGTAQLNLPFLKEREEPPDQPEADNDEMVVIVTDTPAPTPSATPVPKAEALRAVALPRTALSDGTAAALVEQAGGNAAWFDMKADDGSLGYVSQLPAAAALGTSDSNPALNEAIQALNSGELYTVARVSCFRDHRAPRQKNALSLKTGSGYNWWDENDNRWLDVTVPEVRDYVSGVCGELAALGFDEIVLDYAGYPTAGPVAKLRSGDYLLPANRTMTVDAFYRQVSEAVHAVSPEIRLSIVTSGTVLGGGDDLSGQTVTQLETYADRICLPAPEAGTYGALIGGTALDLSQIFLTTPPAGFVYDPAVKALPPDAGGLLLSLPQ